MADITNPQVVAFANNRMRPLADAITKVQYAIDAFLIDANAEGIPALIVAGGVGNFIGDGSDVDGRPRVTGQNMADFRSAITVLQTCLETTTAIASGGVSGTGGKTPSVIISGIQVNGSPRT